MVTEKTGPGQQGFLGMDYSAADGVPFFDLKSDFLSNGEPFERKISGEDIPDIIFTSGTTGRSKGVMMNHRQSLRRYAECCPDRRRCITLCSRQAPDTTCPPCAPPSPVPPPSSPTAGCTPVTWVNSTRRDGYVSSAVRRTSLGAFPGRATAQRHRQGAEGSIANVTAGRQAAGLRGAGAIAASCARTAPGSRPPTA